MRILYLLATAPFLTGCVLVERLSNIGEPPEFSHIQNPTQMANYQPVSMPMPTPLDQPPDKMNSLWENGSKAFFKDQRASKVGDIITVLFSVKETANLHAEINNSRMANATLNVPNLYGYQDNFAHFFSKKNSPETVPLVDMTNNPTNIAQGDFTRTNSALFSVACVIIQILPNGNMVIEGREEVRVDKEVLDIAIKGIVRREDISADNTVAGSNIAEGRIAYGGRGDIADMVETPYGNQITNKISPF